MNKKERLHTLELELTLLEIDIAKLNKIKKRVQMKIDATLNGDLFENDSKFVEECKKEINLILNK